KQDNDISRRRDSLEQKKNTSLASLAADGFQEMLASLSQAGAKDSNTMLHKLLTFRSQSVNPTERRNSADKKKKEKSVSGDLNDSFEKLGLKDISNNEAQDNTRRNSQQKLPSLGGLTDKTNESDISLSVSS